MANVEGQVYELVRLFAPKPPLAPRDEAPECMAGKIIQEGARAGKMPQEFYCHNCFSWVRIIRRIIR